MTREQIQQEIARLEDIRKICYDFDWLFNCMNQDSISWKTDEWVLLKVWEREVDRLGIRQENGECIASEQIQRLDKAINKLQEALKQPEVIHAIPAEVTMEDRFPHGFEAWCGTYFEIVQYMTLQLEKQFKLPEAEQHGEIIEWQRSQGHVGLYDLAAKWADEFEELHKATQWDEEDEDGEPIDFYAVIEDFCRMMNTPTITREV